MVNKSQISAEFIFAIGIIFILFLSLLSIFIFKSDELEETESYLDLRQECLKFSNLIAQVYNAGPGASVETYTDQVLTIAGGNVLHLNEKLGEEEVKVAFYSVNTNEIEDGLYADLCQFGTNPIPGCIYPPGGEPLYPSDPDPVTWKCKIPNGPLECEIFGNYGVNKDCSTNNFTNLGDRAGEFNFFFIEDPHIGTDKCRDKVRLIEDRVFGNGTFIDLDPAAVVVTEHVITKGCVNNDYFWFGANLCKQANPEQTGDLVVFNAPHPDFPGFSNGDSWALDNPTAMDQPDFPGTSWTDLQVYPLAHYTDDTSQYGIIQWHFGKGVVAYFSDFTEGSDIDPGSQNLSILAPENIATTVKNFIDFSSTYSCSTLAQIGSEGEFSRDILIENIDEIIFLSNI